MTDHAPPHAAGSMIASLLLPAAAAAQSAPLRQDRRNGDNV